MEQEFQAMVDRSRACLGIERIKTILGYKRRPTFQRKDSAARRWKVVVEKPTYDLTVFKVLDETLEQLPRSASVGKSRVGGVDLNQPRMRAVAEAVTALAARPRGFTASQLAVRIQSRGQTEYGPRRATYDLKKLRAKQMVRKVERTRRYEAIPDGVRALP